MQCTHVPDCQTPAAFAFTWPWGDQGACCAEHRPLVEQTIQNLGRAGEIVLAPLLVHSSPTDVQNVAQLQGKLNDATHELATVKVALNDTRRELFELREQHPAVARENELLRAQVAELQAQIVELKRRTDTNPPPPPPEGESVVE